MTLDDSAAPALQIHPLELPIEELLERLGGERELLTTLAQMQTAETPRALKEIRELLDGGDAASVEHAAHRLVGSLIVFGADDAVIAARSLEQCSREGRLAEARTELPRLEYELQRFLAALDRVLQTPHT